MSSAEGSQALGRRSLRGVAWTLGTQSAVFASQLLTLAVLGRLLSAADMGVVALTLTFLNLTVLTGGGGLSRTLVQRRTVEPVDERTALWASLAWAVANVLTYLLAAEWIAGFFGDERLGPLVAVSGSLALPAALWPLCAARLERRLRFREIGLAELGAFAVPQAVVTVSTALAGAGVWSPVLGAVVGRVLQTAALVAASGWRPGLGFSWSTLTGLARYGLGATGASVAAFLTSSVDYLVAGRVLGAASLGLYAVAYQLASLPRSRVVQAVAAVAFPSLSRLQDEPARLGRAYVRMNAWVGYAVFPLLAALFVLAEPVLGLLFGERWVPAAAALRVLCPAGALMAVRATVGSALNAVGRPALGLAWNLAVLVASVPILTLAAPHGIEALALGVLAVSLLNFVPLQLVLVRLIGLDLAELARELARPAALAVVTAAVTWLGVRVIDGSLVRLIVGSSCFFAVYAALLLVFARHFLAEARRLAVPR